MMYSKRYIALELFFLFVCIPVLLASPLFITIKLSVGLLGFLYVVRIAYKIKVFSTFKPSVQGWQSFLKRCSIIFILIIMATTAFVYFRAPEALFYVPLHKPLLFVVIVFVYSLFSVWPQEFLYRTYFFKRYEMLFFNKKLFIFINGILFSFAHLFFKNILVIGLTFIGGLLFAWTYMRYKSTTLVTIEHALYGSWLFTVGMGEMLAFPGMEN